MSVLDTGPSPLTSLEIAVAALCPAPVAVGATDPRADHDPPFAAEALAVQRATTGRVAEFAAGRAAVRAAMGTLGIGAQPVPNGPDRAPQWPQGVTGSISHCDSVCLSLVARDRDMRALGVDVEPDAPLEPGLWPEILSLVERAWLSAQPEEKRGRLARLIFTAKECVYKCQYQVSGAMIGFDALEVTPDLDTGQFEATLTCAVRGFAAGSCFHGRFAVMDGVIVTVCALPRRPRWSVQGQG